MAPTSTVKPTSRPTSQQQRTALTPLSDNTKRPTSSSTSASASTSKKSTSIKSPAGSKKKKKASSTKKKKKKKVIVEDPKIIREICSAVLQNSLPALRTIFADANGEYTGRYDYTQTQTQQSLLLAAEHGHTDVLQLLLELGSKQCEWQIEQLVNVQQGLLLQRAAYAGQLEACQLLVSLGANINAVSEFYELNALHHSTRQGHLKVTKFLIANHAQLNLQNHGEHNGIHNGWTPLHYVCDGGYTSVVHALVDAGADVDTLSATEETPAAIAAERGHWLVVEYLISKGANIHAKRRGFTLVQWAVYRAAIAAIQFLVAHGAVVELQTTTTWITPPRTLEDVLRLEYSESIYDEIDRAIYRGTRIVNDRAGRDDAIQRIQWRKQNHTASLTNPASTITDLYSVDTAANILKATQKLAVQRLPIEATSLIIQYDQSSWAA